MKQLQNSTTELAQWIDIIICEIFFPEFCNNILLKLTSASPDTHGEGDTGCTGIFLKNITNCLFMDDNIWGRKDSS